LPYLKKAE
jgi:hypothetical protein